MPLYDVLLKEGEVIDPASGVRGVMDIAISQGQVAAIAQDIPPAQA